jgi:23S rRNA pseudouridine1911/1915/1917 synthase
MKIIFEDGNILVIDKPAGTVVFPEGKDQKGSLVSYLLERFPALKKIGKPPRHGIVHRLDKDTSGILLIAQNNKTLKFLQKEFKEGKVLKKYLALVVGRPKNKEGRIETLLGRSPKNRKKQKAFLLNEPQAKRKDLRMAATEYKVLKYLSDGENNYTLVEVLPKTGRKHQIRIHLAYLGYPVAGDKIYGFKRQPIPKGLSRHFLHASYLKIELPDGQIKEFYSPLTQDLNKALSQLVKIQN